MSVAVFLLAISGFIAALLRAFIALLAVLRSGVDSFLARDLASVRGQRGDLTGVADATALRAAARRRRMLAIGIFSFWLGLLVVPVLTPWPTFLYAAYSLLWLVPRRGPRRRPPSPQ
ncbi:hypothetical protein BH23GEM9_BH23GEM9_13950 [soil metagenome]